MALKADIDHAMKANMISIDQSLIWCKYIKISWLLMMNVCAYVVLKQNVEWWQIGLNTDGDKQDMRWSKKYIPVITVYKETFTYVFSTHFAFVCDQIWD